MIFCVIPGTDSETQCPNFWLLDNSAGQSRSGITRGLAEIIFQSMNDDRPVEDGSVAFGKRSEIHAGFQVSHPFPISFQVSEITGMVHIGIGRSMFGFRRIEMSPGTGPIRSATVSIGVDVKPMLARL